LRPLLPNSGPESPGAYWKVPGKAKHAVLRYMTLCPFVQFPLLTRSGNAKGALVKSPRGSPPTIGVNGMPVRTRIIFVNDHPRSGAAHLPKRGPGEGSARIEFALKTWRTSKSDGPRLNRR